VPITSALCYLPSLQYPLSIPNLSADQNQDK
jgi:hypothetical protein